MNEEAVKNYLSQKTGANIHLYYHHGTYLRFSRAADHNNRVSMPGNSFVKLNMRYKKNIIRLASIVAKAYALILALICNNVCIHLV